MARSFKILVMVVLIAMGGAYGCSGSGNNEFKKLAQAVLKDKEVRIHFKHWKADFNNPKKITANYVAFFEEGEKLGLFEIRRREKFIVGVLKDEHREKFGYKSPPNNFVNYYTFVAGNIIIDKVEKDEKYSQYTVGDLVKYWGHFEPNELGRLLLKHGLGEKLDLDKEISGTLEIQKSESGGWLWKKKGGTFFKKYNPL